MKIGDRVKFKTEVCTRAGMSPEIVKARGVIVETFGKVCRVDFAGTFNSITGETVRSVPTANLIKIKG